MKTRNSNFYKIWIHDGYCMPHIAACLIQGFNPKEPIQTNTQYRNIKLKSEEIVKILCAGSDPKLYKKSIFWHVNTALKYRVIVAEDLLAEIEASFLAYIEKDQEEFVKNFPYLANKLDLLNKSTMPQRSATAKRNIPNTERNLEWQRTANIIISKNPTWNKNSVAEELLSRLKESNPSLVKKVDGTYYPVGTILKNIRMGTTSRK